MFSNVAHHLAQLRQGSTPILQYEHSWNSVAQPVLHMPQHQQELQRLYAQSLNRDLRAAIDGRQFKDIFALQQEIRMLARKFASIDAYNTLYTLKQGDRPIAHHNYQIDSLLNLLEVPIPDDLLQLMYKGSLRPDVLAALQGRDFPSFAELRRAVAMISR